MNLKRSLGLSAAIALALAPATGLAQTKVSHLPAGSTVAATDLAPMSQSCSGSPPTATCSATNAVTAAQLGQFAAGTTAHGLVVGQNGAASTNVAAMSNGQIAVGQTSADPQAKTVSGDATLAASGALTVTKTNGTSFGPGATGLGYYAVTITGVDLHTATGDVAHFVLPSSVNDFHIGNQVSTGVAIWGCSSTTGSVTWGLWSAASAGGTALVASSTSTTFGGATGTAITTLTGNGNWVAGHDVYLNVSSANSTALTCNVTVTYRQLG